MKCTALFCRVCLCCYCVQLLLCRVLYTFQYFMECIYDIILSECLPYHSVVTKCVSYIQYWQFSCQCNENWHLTSPRYYVCHVMVDRFHCETIVVGQFANPTEKWMWICVGSESLTLCNYRVLLETVEEHTVCAVHAPVGQEGPMYVRGVVYFAVHISATADVHTYVCM